MKDESVKLLYFLQKSSRVRNRVIFSDFLQRQNAVKGRNFRYYYRLVLDDDTAKTSGALTRKRGERFFTYGDNESDGVFLGRNPGIPDFNFLYPELNHRRIPR